MRIFTPAPPKHRLIGHRGLAARAPENTLAGFELAAKEGINWVEFDVQLTADHFLVIIHDDTVDRTTNGHGLVYKHNMTDLLQLDAGSWFDSKFANQRIPELATVLPKLFNLDLQLNIELKVPAHPPPGHLYRFALVFAQTLQSIWPANRPEPLVSSFNWRLLEGVRTYLPSLPIGYLSETCSFKMIDTIIPIHNAALHCNADALNPALIEYAQVNGLPLLAYTVNEAKQAKDLLDQGVFALFSDDPTRLLKEIPSIP